MSQTLTEIKQLLAGHGLRPKHRLGQNFLHDHNHLVRILDAAEVAAGDVVLEVGPGTGALTERLLAAGAEVVACEVDRDLEAVLRERIDTSEDRFTLVVGDVLADKRTLNAELLDRLASRRFKLIANLPYQVASPLLANLVLDHPAMDAAVVMVQKEVADRLAAPPGGKDYGALGVLVQAVCLVRRVGVLPPSCFWPAPKVSSAVVHFQRRPEPLTDDPHALAGLLHTLFGKRRKQLGAILGRGVDWPAGVEPTMRPEQLTVEQLVALSRLNLS
ncbi:MAG: 16S rRNA (adenine(1518)-N(6)/adenine(1519)-N(6))-dimethyltransferase RsmA [Planctomycetota bacterium]